MSPLTGVLLSRDRTRRVYAPNGWITKKVSVRHDKAKGTITLYAPVPKRGPHYPWAKREPGHFIRLGTEWRAHVQGEVTQALVDMIHAFRALVWAARLGNNDNRRTLRGVVHNYTLDHPTVNWLAIIDQTVRELTP